MNGVIATSTGSINTSEISSLLDQNSLVYSNGNSEIWIVDQGSGAPLTVNKAGSTTTAVLSSSTITLGGSVGDTATVTPAGATGVVDFQVSSDGGVTWLTFDAETLSGGSATSALYTPLNSGSYYFRAVYTGDSRYAGSQSGSTAEPLTVNAAGSTTTAVLSSSTITLGGSVGDTATVTPAGATGVVDFQVSSDGGVTWLTFDAETLSGGSATSALYTPLNSGSYYFRAVYTGDSRYAGSQSGSTAEPLTVNAAGSTTTAVLSSSTITLGGSVGDTATVTPAGATGVVDFQVSSDGGVTWLTFDAETLSGGSATSALYTPLNSGVVYFRAVYTGDSRYAGSQSGSTAEPLTVFPLFWVSLYGLRCFLRVVVQLTFDSEIISCIQKAANAFKSIAIMQSPCLLSTRFSTQFLFF